MRRSTICWPQTRGRTKCRWESGQLSVVRSTTCGSWLTLPLQSLQLRVREHPVLGPYVEDLSTWVRSAWLCPHTAGAYGKVVFLCIPSYLTHHRYVVSSFSDIEVRRGCDVRSCTLCAHVYTVYSHYWIIQPSSIRNLHTIRMYVRIYVHIRSSPKSFRKQIFSPYSTPNNPLIFTNLTYLPLVKRSDTIGWIRVDSYVLHTYTLYTYSIRTKETVLLYTVILSCIKR